MSLLGRSYLTEKLIRNPGILKFIVYLGRTGCCWESEMQDVLGYWTADKVLQTLRRGRVLQSGKEYNKDEGCFEYRVHLTPEAREMLPYMERILSTQKISAELTV